MTQGSSEDGRSLTAPESPAPAAGTRDLSGAFPVVGIGASAGGLQASRELLEAMPSNAGLCLILIQHLDPNHDSLMAELLAKHCRMPVSPISDGMRLHPDRIYTIPPNRYVELEGGRFRLSEAVPDHGRRMPIDHFFGSLADACGSRSVAVILSGTGSDGSSGLEAIKAAGGLTIACEPAEATHDGMPKAAIATGNIDYVLPIRQIPHAIRDHGNHSDSGHDQIPPQFDKLDAARLHGILGLLRRQAGYDFRCYKKGTLFRRIARRMSIRHLHTLGDYEEFLQSDSDEARKLCEDLLIGVTSFFRDPVSWSVLEEKVLVPLVSRLPEGQTLRVWVPACSTGEEAYSVAMLLYEAFDRAGKSPTFQIFATDIDEGAIARGRAARYPDSVGGNLSSERLQQFFEREGERLRASKRLRDRVVFAVQNVVADPPFSSLDLICCRNLLIYLESKTQQDLLDMFHFALRENGILFLGGSESLGKRKTFFHIISKNDRIFRKRQVPGKTRPRLAHSPGDPPAPDRASSRQTARPKSVAETAREAILALLAPPSVVVDSNREALFFHGPVSRYFNYPEGEPTRDLPSICHPSISSAVRAVIHRTENGSESSRTSVSMKRDDGSTVAVTITGKRIGSTQEDGGLILISFTEEPVLTVAEEETEGGGRDEALTRLEEELKRTRESLHETIEEQDAANEELKASNEEAVSINEELQSTNEELESSREELQSLNEELSTVNAELEEKVRELETTNDDLSNLLSSTDIATIFLDRNLCIRRFTPSTRQLISLLPADIGRPLSDIAPRFVDAELRDDARKVLNGLRPIETEISSGEHAYLRRVVPYRTSDREVGGVVITFSDVSEIRHHALQLKRRERQQAVIAELGRKALKGLPMEQLAQEAVTAIAREPGIPLVKVLKLEPERGQLLMIAGVGWHVGLVGNARVPSDAGSQAGYTIQSATPIIVEDLREESRFTGPQLLLDHGVVSGLSVTIGPESNPWGVLGAHSPSKRDFTIEDVHFLQAIANILYEQVRRNETLRELESSRRRYRLVVDSLPVLVALCDAKERYLFCNAAYQEWFSRAPEEIIGRTVRELVGDRAYEEVGPNIQRALRGETVVYRANLPYANEKARDVEISYVPDIANGEVLGFYAMIQDVGEQVKAEQLMREARQVLEKEVNAKKTELDLLSSNVPALFAYIGPRLRFRHVNSVFEKKFHMKPGEFIGKSVRQAFGTEAYAELAPRFADALDGEEQRFDITVDLPRDGVRAFNVRCVPHRDAESQVIGIYFLADDITEIRKLQREVLDAAELEKERMGRELHDGLCQELTGVGMFGHVLSEKLRRNGEEGASEAAELVARINNIVKQSRDIARGLCPVSLQNRGLGEALSDLCAMVPELFGRIRCEVDYQLDTEPPEGLGTQLFIIAREAVFNAARHARATRVQISVESVDRKLVVKVRDDGQGRADGIQEGLGIRSMRYRAQILGGSLEVRTASDEGGLEVICTVRGAAPPKLPQAAG